MPTVFIKLEYGEKEEIVFLQREKIQSLLASLQGCSSEEPLFCFRLIRYGQAQLVSLASRLLD
jgi:hypothetical protein